MLVNRIIPEEMRDRICIHCGEMSKDKDPVTYLIAGKGQGKTTETIRQAVFRRNTILSTEHDFYRSAGMKHRKDAKEGEVSYMALGDLFTDKLTFEPGTTLNLCVDNAKEILEEILSQRYGVNVKINFMSLEA